MKLARSAFAWFLATSCTVGLANPVMTGFKPEVNGFFFTNDYVNDVIPALDIRTKGLCGGMSYAALDYYHTGVPLPTQPFQPATGTTLYNYFYERNKTAILGHLSQWADIGANPQGIRNRELFMRGVNGKQFGELYNLIDWINHGKPCVLALQGDGKEGNHQVIAYGYDMGRYQGDKGDFMGDLKIYVCDPNHPREARILVPDTQKLVYRYGANTVSAKVRGGSGDGDETWRTFFVDTTYAPAPPPRPINGNYPDDGKIHEIILNCFTGHDDLRGGDDNIDAVINFTDGTQQVVRSINQRARWVVNYHSCAEIPLTRPVPSSSIKSIVLTDTFSGGVGGDNWDLDAIHIGGWGSTYKVLKTVTGKRFTGDDRTFVIEFNAAPPAADGKVTRLRFRVTTTDDDLRGGSDNLSVTVLYRDGRREVHQNVNNGAKWPNDSTRDFAFDLNAATDPADIVGVQFQTSSTSGINGDNWNLGAVNIWIEGPGLDREVAHAGPHRFTGEQPTFQIKW